VDSLDFFVNLPIFATTLVDVLLCNMKIRATQSSRFADHVARDDNRKAVIG